MNDPHGYIQAYLDNELDAGRFDAFQGWLREDTEHLREWVLACFVSNELPGCLSARPGRGHEPIQTPADAARQGVLDADMLGAMMRLQAPPDEPGVINITRLLAEQKRQRADDHLTRQDVLAAVGFLAHRAVRSKAAAIAAAAALVLLGAVLAIVFLAGGPDATDPIAQTPGQPPPIDEPIGARPVVATLTAEHDAVWDRRPGEDLFAGQRLQLVDGFAQIKTRRGAVAILEAPATVELTDSPNAIRLHRGRLVGICETESSKGFLVHTPLLDVIDLGTRFGVDASNPRRTGVHVFQGEVEVVLPDTESRPEPVQQRLIAGQAVAAHADGDKLVVISEDMSRFAALSPTTVELPGTGTGVDHGQPDNRWRIISVGGQALDKPLKPVVWWGKGLSEHESKPNDPAVSQWIGLSGAGKTTYVFRTEIELPEKAQASAYRLDMDFAVDNLCTAIRVNGSGVAVPERALEDFDLQRMVIDRHLRPGNNVIEFEIFNKDRAPDAAVGIRIEWRALEMAQEKLGTWPE